jgi:hypothetical protein
MSYPTCIAADIGTASLTLLAAITNANGSPHATVRDLACAEIGQGQYQLVTTAIPYGYIGSIVFYTTALASASVWTGSTIQAITDTSSIAPLAAIKAAVYDSATVSGATITLADAATVTKSAGNRVTIPP